MARARRQRRRSPSRGLSSSLIFGRGPDENRIARDEPDRAQGVHRMVDLHSLVNSLLDRISESILAIQKPEVMAGRALNLSLSDAELRALCRERLKGIHRGDARSSESSLISLLGV